MYNTVVLIPSKKEYLVPNVTLVNKDRESHRSVPSPYNIRDVGTVLWHSRFMTRCAHGRGKRIQRERK